MQNGETPLLQACYAGKLEAAKLLLSRGAYLNIPEKDGWTALHWASRKGHAAIVDELLRQGADPSLPNKVTLFSIIINNQFFFIVEKCSICFL